jgi:hypothetical protein
MITPITSAQPVDASPALQPPAEVKPDPKAETPPVPKSGQLSHDQVTLKSAGQPDHDGGRG